MAKAAIPLGHTGRAVAANIARIRKARRLSQRELSALMAKASRPMGGDAISKIEIGERRVDVDDLAAFVKALAIPIEQLLSGTALLPPGPKCETCWEHPAPGFSCLTCGAEGMVE